MRLTKFSLAALLAACALAAAAPSGGSGSSSSDSSSSSSSDSGSDSGSSSSSSDSDSDSCSRHKVYHKGHPCHKYSQTPAPWEWRDGGKYPYWTGEYGHYGHEAPWQHSWRHRYFDGVYVYIDGEYTKVSALLTLFLPKGNPHLKYVKKGCTAIDHHVNQVAVAPMNSVGVVKTTFYGSLEDCESGKDPVKRIGKETFADLDGKFIGAVHIKVPKNPKHKKHHPHRHHHKEEHRHGKGKKHSDD